MKPRTLPDWAEVGAEVVISRRRIAEVGRISRMSATSVWIKIGASSYEHRYVPTRYTDREESLEEYGQGSSWSATSYAYAAASERGKNLLKQARLLTLQRTAQTASTAFEKSPGAETARAAMNAYEAYLGEVAEPVRRWEIQELLPSGRTTVRGTYAFEDKDKAEAACYALNVDLDEANHHQVVLVSGGVR